MKNFHFLLLFILIFLQVYLSNAQNAQSSPNVLPKLKVDNWQMEQGLPVNSIMTIAQSTDGWLFFGTEEGLVRFDGEEFSLMNKFNIPDLSVNFISKLLGSRDSSLWIGTEGDGLIRYKKNSFKKYDKSNGLSDNRIFALYEDSIGGLWIGTSGGGLNYLKNDTITTYNISNGLTSNYIRSITMDVTGRIWVGTQKGLSVIDHGKIINYGTKDGLSDDFIESLTFDKERNLWIGTKSGGLNLFKEDQFTVYTMNDGLTHNAVTTLICDRNGMLWIGTNGGGISRMFHEKFYPFTTRDGLSGDLIVTLFEDREGNIWAGSSGSGIDRIKKKQIQTLSLKDGLSGDVILPVFEDHDGVVWLGVAGKGLNRIENGKIQTFDQQDGLPDHLILTICEDLNNTLWIGTAGGGLTSMKNGKFTTYTNTNGLSNNVVTALHCDKSGTLWAGTTGGGLNQFKNGEFSAFTTKEGLSNENITSILEDKKGDLWVGTNGGLNRIKDNNITVITKKNGLSNDYILSMYEDKEGNMWVGTASNGFNLLRDGKITQFTMKDGLINEVVLKILEDDFGYFWISCNKGIYKIKKQDLLDFADLKINQLLSVSYGKADGMESIECNGGISPAGCKTREGLLLFPTMKGISIIDPKMMHTASTNLSPIYLDKFLVDGQHVELTSSMTIPSDSKRLEFRYTSLNYTNPEKLKYRCMLEGFDKKWIECGTHRSAYYTNIPGGSYVFKVMASNENGQWNEQAMTELKFRLIPPFYRSFLFYLILLFFVLLLIFFVSYYFIERFQRARLSRLVDERTNELHQKMVAEVQIQEELRRTNTKLIIAKEQAESSDRLKTAFINNISHEIRTPLNGILGFSQIMADSDLSQDEKEQYLQIVKSSSDRLINTVTAYMDMSLITSGNQKITNKLFAPIELLEEIYERFHDRCLGKNLDLQLRKPLMAHEFQIISDFGLLHKVFCHLLDNSIKFTLQGSVTFGFDVIENTMKFFVIDTGIGIDQDSHETIFNQFVQGNVSDTRGYEGSGLGLSIVKGIIELLGSHIWVESEIGKGFSIYFTVPVNKKQAKKSKAKR